MVVLKWPLICLLLNRESLRLVCALVSLTNTFFFVPTDLNLSRSNGSLGRPNYHHHHHDGANRDKPFLVFVESNE